MEESWYQTLAVIQSHIQANIRTQQSQAALAFLQNLMEKGYQHKLYSGTSLWNIFFTRNSHTRLAMKEEYIKIEFLDDGAYKVNYYWQYAVNVKSLEDPIVLLFLDKLYLSPTQ
ncbi:hypothetical protein LX64_04401 [Chitinophaga skermanii]|uniref:Uncharacterized protein n=1 Tax=Chitinophaga skermanii TaxID=331697 RepID=A0A327Q5X6_9BACT|nr:hypothetical protein [Chitinophaga skermanii]RAI99848.1 hypothetical protein LX64_04401 [Chitinophaga skermanii]